MSLKKNFLSVVNKALHEEYCHKKLLKSIENIFDKNNLEDFLNVYFKALFHLYCAEYANKNPFVARGLEFLAKLAIKITLKCVKPMDITNPNGTLSQVYDVTTDQFFNNILKCSLKYASVDKPEIRFNTCYFIMVLLQNIGNNVEMDYNLCNEILESLLELLDDPKVIVRLQALKALVRLQEPGNPECVVLNSFLVLFADANNEVRKAVIKLVAPHPHSFAKIRERLNDIDCSVRLAAYTKWADTNPKLYLKIVDRNFILACGFADSYKKITQILTEKLLPKWLNAYEGNYLNLLKALKLDADENDINNFEDLCTKVMEVYLKVHPFSDIVKYLPINKENKVIPIEELHIESVLYWSILVSFLRNRDDGEEYLEDILPELTAFSNYIERVIKEKSTTSMDEWENLEYQIIILQMFKMASKFDMSDEVGRKTFYALILQILSTNKFQQNVVRVIINVASQLNKNVGTLTSDMCQVISDIREPLVDDTPSEETLRARNFQTSQLKVKIHRLEIAEEDALKVKDFQHANIVHNEIKECQRQLENLSSIASQSEKVRTTKDDPETICRCLDILIGLLQTHTVNMSEALMTCRDEFLMPLINNNISDIHWRFILCLGLYSLIDKDTAFKHANFICLPIATYRAVPNYDKKALKTSVACITDLIRLYGVKVIGIEGTNSEMNQENNQSNNRRKLYSEDMDELRAVNKDDINIEFIIDIIVDMLDDEDEDVRNTAATAISRLMIFNFPVSPELITRLIIKWYHPLTAKKDTKLQQLVGFIISCFTDHVEGSRGIIGKAVIPIIFNLANAPRNSPLVEVDIDNVLKFLSALTIPSEKETRNIHRSLALSVIEKLSNKPNDVCTPYFAKLLTYLDVGFDDPTTLKNMISTIEFILPDILDKMPHKNLVKFMNQLKTGCNPEEPQNTIGDNQPICESTGIENGSEVNVADATVQQENNGFKSSKKSSSPSSVSNDNEKAQEVPKSNSSFHDIDGHTSEVRENIEPKDRKGNSDSEDENLKEDESCVRKNLEVSGRPKRTRQQKSFKKSLQIRPPALLKILEESDSEQTSTKSDINKKGDRKGQSEGKTERVTKTSNGINSGGENTDEYSSTFVKCDYKTLKDGVKNGLNSISPKLLDNKSESTKDKPKDLKHPSGKMTHPLSNKSQNVKIISQVVLGTSGTNINDIVQISSEEKRVTRNKKHITAQSVGNSDKTKLSKKSNNMTASSNSSHKKDEIRSENVPSTDRKTTERSSRQLSKTFLNGDRNPVLSPTVILTPLKVKDTKLDDLSQDSSDKTPLKKRVATTPLSTLGDRLLKKSSSRMSVRSAPTKLPSTVNTTKNSRLSRSSSNTVDFERRVLRVTSRQNNDRSSVSTPIKKRRFDTPNSLLKQKPNKIAKTATPANQNKKEIDNNKSIVRKGTSGDKNEENKKEKTQKTKEITLNKPKDVNNRDRTDSNKKKIINSKVSTKSTLKEVDINEEKKQSNQFPKKILSSAGRIGVAKLEEKVIQKQGKNETSSSGSDNCKTQSSKGDSHRLKDTSSDTPKNGSSSTHCRVLRSSDLNSKVITKISKSTKSVENRFVADPDVKTTRSTRLQKSKSPFVNIVNQSLKSCDKLKSNGEFSVEGSPQSSPFTSTVTRSRSSREQMSTRHRSSKRQLNFSTTSEETILKTFLQGDEEFQILENMSIENISSSNSSEDSKKENLSINTSTSSNSNREMKTPKRKLPRRKHTLSPSSRSPRRKILRSSKRKLLRSALQ